MSSQLAMTYIALVVLFTLALLPALVMVFVPLFPTFWYLLAIASIFAAIDGFVHVTLGNLWVLVGIFAASIMVDWSAGLLGGKFGGAAWKSILWGGVGALVGFFVVPPLGALAGLFCGVVLSELRRVHDMHKALKAGVGSLIGTAAGLVANMILAISFVILFVAFAIA